MIRAPKQTKIMENALVSRRQKLCHLAARVQPVFYGTSNSASSLTSAVSATGAIACFSVVTCA